MMIHQFLLTILLMVVLTSKNTVVAFQLLDGVMRSSSTYSRGVLKYKKESNNNQEHHPHLKQGENVFESTINRVLREDTDCPLLKHQEAISSKNDEHERKEDAKTLVVPSTIDSLPSELVDLTAFKNDMQGQARMRVPSFNARGYKSSLIRDLKPNMPSVSNPQKENTKGTKVQSSSSASNVISVIQSRWNAIRAHRFWIAMKKTFQIMASKCRLLGKHLSKIDWSPLLQWVILVFALHVMCYHDIQPSSLGFHLLF